MVEGEVDMAFLTIELYEPYESIYDLLRIVFIGYKANPFLKIFLAYVLAARYRLCLG